MTARALWFGPPERPLFGWVHVPASGRARGGVVLCPALGVEGIAAHRAYRHLAELLEAEGLAVVRFDYDGTGDSAGDNSDPARVEAWLRSVGAAADLLRDAGAPGIALVGMRVGATLAACQAASHGAVDSLVLWDPCASGRAYVREQRALGLFALTEDDPGDGSIEVPGTRYGADTVAELARLAIATTEGPLARRVLVLARPDRVQPRAMVQRLTMPHVEWRDATEQAGLLDVEPFVADEPVATVAEIAAWLADVAGTDAAPLRVPERSEAVITDAQGHTVRELICTVGPLGLFAVSTEPIEAHDAHHRLAPSPSTRGRRVVFLNAGVIDHVGPSRLWVELARQWAGAGVRVLRFDLSGLGDSPARPGQREDIMYPPDAFEDLSEVVASLVSEAPEERDEVVFVGLCSGGYHSVEAGIALGADHGVDKVCLINPILTAKPSEIYWEDPDRGTPRVDPRRRATTARRRWVRALPAHDRIGSVINRLPDGAWWLINRIAVASPPARILEQLVGRGVDAYIVCGEPEAKTLRRGQRAALRRLARSGRFRLDVVPGIDHELFARQSRELVRPMVTEWVLAPGRERAGDDPPASPRVRVSTP